VGSLAAGNGEAGFLGMIRVPKKAVGSQRQSDTLAATVPCGEIGKARRVAFRHDLRRRKWGIAPEHLAYQTQVSSYHNCQKACGKRGKKTAFLKSCLRMLVIAP